MYVEVIAYVIVFVQCGNIVYDKLHVYTVAGISLLNYLGTNHVSTILIVNAYT